MLAFLKTRGKARSKLDGTPQQLQVQKGHKSSSLFHTCHYSLPTCVTPLRSMRKRLMVQLPLLMACSSPKVMVSVRMHLAMSNCRRQTRHEAERAVRCSCRCRTCCGQGQPDKGCMQHGSRNLPNRSNNDNAALVKVHSPVWHGWLWTASYPPGVSGPHSCCGRQERKTLSKIGSP